MNAPLATPLDDQRTSHRLPWQLSVTEYIAGYPQRALAFDLSPEGLQLRRLHAPDSGVRSPRPDEKIGLEFVVPGSDEIIWAVGEVRFTRCDGLFHRSGVLIRNIAGLHAKLLRDFLASIAPRGLAVAHRPVSHCA